MSASLRVRTGAVAAGLFCWLLSAAGAEELNPNNPPIDTTQPPANAATNRGGQIDRAKAPPTTDRVLRNQPYTANFRAAQGNAQPAQEVNNYLVNCLLKKNKAEVELSQFAAGQTQNPQVKEFAQQLAKDHQQLVQKLEQLATPQADARHTGSPALDANAATGTDRTTIGATGGRPAASSFDPATPNTGTASAATNSNRDATANTAAMHGSAALQQLAGIEQKINERCQQALREELQQKSGAEFDECYVGSQIGGHMHMLAALEVISQETQGPLKQAAEEARPLVQKHLDHAKELMAQAKAGSQNTAQRASATETQR
jgi:predicted outer membrane protein